MRTIRMSAADRCPIAKFKFTLNAEQRVPMPAIGWDLVLNGNYAYRTSAEMLPDQNPHGVQGPYGILNLSGGP